MSDDSNDDTTSEQEEPSAPQEEPSAAPHGTAHCSNCDKDVHPRGRGSCPICGRILKGFNFARRSGTQPNIQRREQLVADLIAEYQPKTMVLRTQIAHLAGIYEALETTKAGTVEHQRLIVAAKQISETLDAAEAEGKTATIATNLYEGQSSAYILARIDQLREQARRFVAGEISDLTVPPGLPSALSAGSERRGLPESKSSERFDPSLAPHTAGLSDDPCRFAAPLTCPYGCGTLARCAQIKVERPDAWRAFHHLDPSEVARRDEEATKEMYESLRRHGPARY